MKRSALGLILSIALLAIACSKEENIIPKPNLLVSNETTTNWNGCIMGEAVGVNPNLYHVAIYMKTNDLWYTIPHQDSPAIAITNESHWMCQNENMPVESMTEMVIFLLPNTFNPPLLDGEVSLPLKLSLLAVAQYKIILKDTLL